MSDLPPLLLGLLRPEAYPHPVDAITLLETHISWVIRTGAFAYKLKKPVNLGFLDFTSLERRHHFCAEELRLNRRFGSDLYLAVMPISGSLENPRVGGDGAALEYAVQMRQFDEADLLPVALERGAITAELLDGFADRLAQFHGQAAQADPAGPAGSAAAVLAPVQANFRALQGPTAAGLSSGQRATVQAQQRWADQEFARLQSRFAERLAAGRVRECHGDLHLGNLVLYGGRIEAFDCLEFSPALRWIDVISDLAFLVMDLQHRGHGALATRLLNRWLEESGDHGGLDLWRWYGAYRALVRAKVAALSGDGGGLSAYLARAEAIALRRARVLLLTHGYSGAGKSHHSGQLIEPLEAIRLRSDVERKRLFGLWGQAPTAPRSGDLYAQEVSEELFAELLPARAAAVLAAGFNVIVDATFLRRQDRQRMAAVAQSAGVPLVILDVQLPEAQLRQRIAARLQHRQDPSDADLAVLERQVASAEPLSGEERQLAVVVAGDAPGERTLLAVEEHLRRCQPALQ